MKTRRGGRGRWEGREKDKEEMGAKEGRGRDSVSKTAVSIKLGKPRA